MSLVLWAMGLGCEETLCLTCTVCAGFMKCLSPQVSVSGLWFVFWTDSKYALYTKLSHFVGHGVEKERGTAGPREVRH